MHSPQQQTATLNIRAAALRPCMIQRLTLRLDVVVGGAIGIQVDQVRLGILRRPRTELQVHLV